ncbi:MAG TPA: methylmalonyl-CoA mutase family protein [Thermoanaerobaculia bacterium]|nr:methylmalonyl-CoA mutase family protein [Thermoanaerobaculia bacterium]HUM28664.1 methylmalonyl-CoA mutase family protein [Thermoanaerobaculia bacterium]HXK66728.1 methylmalonyl-CoA mutase family protein [Thermoanaerobaculia bacterium]
MDIPKKPDQKKDDHQEISEARNRWTAESLEPTFEQRPPWKKDFTTVSGMDVPILATPDSVSHLDYLQDLGFPGHFPFTRGPYPTMYRGKLWTMRQFAGFGTARDTNERFHYLLKHGQTGLSVAFHLPTLYGYDSDDEFSRGEVGRCGVAIDTLADMETLFEGIDLERVTTSMTINSTAPIAFAMYLAVAEKQGADYTRISGTIQNDILKEYIAQKEFIYPPRPSMRLITDVFAFAAERVPKFNTISISGYHIREAGSTALQELAFTLRDGMEYVEYGVRAGLDVDAFAPRLSFFFNAHNDFFEEIGKYRAARRIWARVMKERYGARHPDSWRLRFHTQTAGCSLTAQQPYNNVVRVAIQALAGVLGGTQSLHTNSMDETFALPTEDAVTIALRTQQIIAHETGVAHTIDPLAGSYFVETLTNRMEEGTFDYFDKIDAYGGMVEAVEAAFPQREIWEAAYRYQQSLDRNEKLIVGVNAYQMKEEQNIPTLVIEERVEREQLESLNRVRRERNGAEVTRCLDELRRAAEGADNLMPPILACVKCYCTVQEISDVLRDIFGTYMEPAIF